MNNTKGDKASRASGGTDSAVATAVERDERGALGWPWLAEVHADAAYLFHRVQQGSLSPDDAAKIVRDKIDRASARAASPFSWPPLPDLPKPFIASSSCGAIFTEHQMQGYANAYGEAVRVALAKRNSEC